MPHLVPFAELTGGPGGVRLAVIQGKTYMSIRDIIMVVCRKHSNMAGETWRNISEEHKAEVADCLHYHQFPGQGQREQPVITLEGAVKLIMWLPGKVAKGVRARAAEILVAFFDNETEAFTSWTVDTAEQVQQVEAAREPETQYVYAAVSEAFPGLVKIGFTSSLDARMESANTFCAPAPFKIAAHAPSLDPRRDEHMAHAFFAAKREEGEFFRVSVEDVEVLFNTSILPMYKLERKLWSNVE